MTKTVDSFTGTAGTQLQNHTPDQGGPWVQQSGDAGACELNGSGYLERVVTTAADACYTVDTGAADHYAQCVLGSQAPGASCFEVCVRCANASNFYGAWGGGSGHVYVVYKRVAGSFTILYTSSQAAQSGDTLKLTITGSTLQLWVNGVQVGGNITDTALSTTTTVGVVPHQNVTINPWLTSWQSDANSSGTALTVDGVAALEFLSSLRRDAVAPIEYAALFTRDTPAPTESLDTMRGDAIAPAEWLSTFTRDGSSPGEFLAGLTRDGAGPMELLGTVHGDGRAPLEFSGSLGVTVDGISPLEWRATLALDGKAPTEFAAKLTADSDAPAEWLGSLAWDSLVPLAWVSTVIRDGSAPTEFTATLRLDGEVPAEWLVTVVRDGSVPDGWLATLSRDGLAPLEFSGSAVAGIFDSFVPIEWALLPNPSRRYTLIAPRWRYTALAPKLSYVALIPGNAMPALRDLPPIDATNQTQTIALDFGQFLPPGVTLKGTPTVQISVHGGGSDPNPSSRITGAPVIGTAPTTIGGSGVANAAVLVQLGNLLGGVTYLIWGWCERSDGDEASGWTHTSGVTPT